MAHTMLVNQLAIGTTDEVEGILQQGHSEALKEAVAHLEELVRKTGASIALVVAPTVMELPQDHKLEELLAFSGNYIQL